MTFNPAVQTRECVGQDCGNLVSTMFNPHDVKGNRTLAEAELHWRRQFARMCGSRGPSKVDIPICSKYAFSPRPECKACEGYKFRDNCPYR